MVKLALKFLLGGPVHFRLRGVLWETSSNDVSSNKILYIKMQLYRSHMSRFLRKIWCDMSQMPDIQSRVTQFFSSQKSKILLKKLIFLEASFHKSIVMNYYSFFTTK
jgi:hypothetical protein